MTPERIEELARHVCYGVPAERRHFENCREALRTAVREALDAAAKECSTLPAWCDWEHYVERIHAIRDELTGKEG